MVCGLLWTAGGKLAVGNIANVNTDFEWRLQTYNDGFATTAPVGQFPRGESPYGAQDMAGNVWEWTNDRYESGQTRVLRGGSWNYYPRYVRASYRVRNDPTDRYEDNGFRCAQSLSF